MGGLVLFKPRANSHATSSSSENRDLIPSLKWELRVCAPLPSWAFCGAVLRSGRARPRHLVSIPDRYVRRKPGCSGSVLFLASLPHIQLPIKWWSSVIIPYMIATEIHHHTYYILTPTHPNQLLRTSIKETTASHNPLLLPITPEGRPRRRKFVLSQGTS